MMKLSLLGSGLLLTALLLNGCGPSAAPDKAGESVFRYGTTAYGVAMENAGMDPHESYKGWSTLRYGVGETLFRFNEAMQPQPWLATGYEFLDDHTVKIEGRRCRKIISVSLQPLKRAASIYGCCRTVSA